MAKTTGVIKFSEELTESTVDEFITQLSDKLNQHDNVILYWTCPGGAVCEARVVTDFLNRYADRVEMVGVWTLASAGFDVMFMFKGKRKLVGSAYACLHLASNNLATRNLMDKESYEVFHLKVLNEENEKYLKVLKPILTDEEYARVKEGKDVYLDLWRLKEIFQCETDGGY